MSPSSSKTIVRPSGEISSESQVPSSVVNLSGLAGASGRPAARPAESAPRPPRWARAGVASATRVATTAMWGMKRRILRLGLGKEKTRRKEYGVSRSNAAGVRTEWERDELGLDMEAP